MPRQRHRLIVSIHSSLMLEFVLKEPRPSIESRNDHTLKILNLSVLQILFLIDLRKYSNILRYWMFDFHELSALIIKIKIKQLLKCFTLHVINIEYMQVQLCEIIYKKIIFSRYSKCFRCTCIFEQH